MAAGGEKLPAVFFEGIIFDVEIFRLSSSDSLRMTGGVLLMRV